VREYACIKLTGFGTSLSSAVNHRHATFYADLVQKLNPSNNGLDLLSLMADVKDVQREQDSVRAALGLCVENDEWRSDFGSPSAWSLTGCRAGCSARRDNRSICCSAWPMRARAATARLHMMTVSLRPFSAHGRLALPLRVR
jgi:hypothetical protein